MNPRDSGAVTVYAHPAGAYVMEGAPASSPPPPSGGDAGLEGDELHAAPNETARDKEESARTEFRIASIVTYKWRLCDVALTQTPAMLPAP
jgi:hypothetical protein